MGKTKYFLIEVGQAQPEYLLYYCSTKMVVMEKKIPTTLSSVQLCLPCNFTAELMFLEGQ